MSANSNTDTRIARLERIVVLLALGVVAMLAWLLLAPQLHATLRTESLELTTPEGNVVAALGSRDGYPVLALNDENGVERVSLFHDAEGSGMYVSDEAGTTRIGIAQFAHGGGGVALHGEDSRGALVLYLKDAGTLRFFDGSGELLREISASDSSTSP